MRFAPLPQGGGVFIWFYGVGKFTAPAHLEESEKFFQIYIDKTVVCMYNIFCSAWSTQLKMGRFPSGQREQTVNLPSPTSMVRIHPCPPSSAGMAELADALDSGSSESNFMQVQVLFPALDLGQISTIWPYFFVSKFFRHRLLNIYLTNCGFRSQNSFIRWGYLTS